MITEEVTYTTFDGEEKTETFMFHLTKPEAVRLQAPYLKYGGLSPYIQDCIRNQDYLSIMDVFETVLKMSYGRRVGQSFIKTEENTAMFVGSPAYEALFLKLFSAEDQGKFALSFLTGILPKDLQGEIGNIQNEQN